jgi:protein-tyrosine phosphatase
LVLEGEAEPAAANNIQFKPFPVRDRGVPASQAAVAALASDIVDALEHGRSVAVHCRKGIGRSAVIAGAVLVAAGETPSTALKTINESRGLDVPETDEQRRWLADFGPWLLAAPAAQQALAADAATTRG